MYILETGERTARKDHFCNLCGKRIKKGEKYCYQKEIYDGEFYEFKEHTRCSFIASQIWDYAEPDEGMDDELFRDTLQTISEAFICPDCQKWDKGFKECEIDEMYCIDKVYEFLQTFELYEAVRAKFGGKIWKCRKKGEEKK